MHVISKSGRRIELPSEEEDLEINRQATEDSTDAGEGEMRMYRLFADSDLPADFKAEVLNFLSCLCGGGRPGRRVVGD